jgi:hypothetical protein
MRIHRGLLFWGLLLLPLGTIPLLVRANVVDPASLGDASRLWPLILVAIGLAIIIGRTRVSIVATAVVALVLGSIGGVALASGTDLIGAATHCGQASSSATTLDRSGTLTPPGAIRLEVNCGTLTVTTAPGSGWQLHATYDGRPPNVDESPSRIEIETPDNVGIQHEDLSVTAPTDGLDALGVTANAAAATVSLAGARLSSLDATMNAGDLVVDASGATIGRIRASTNAGRARITLGSGSITGRLSVNAGSLEVCVPASSSLQINSPDQLTFSTNLDQRGLTRSGNTWTRAGTGGDTIELAIDGAAGSLTLDPAGGCS